jgi:hypothetical protein
MADRNRTGVPRWLRWTLIVGLPLATPVLAYSLFTPQYQTNDDVGMTMIAAGVGLAPEPSPHLLFMHPLLGQLLSALYRFAPNMGWYALLLTAVRVLAGIVLAVAVLGREPSPLRAALLVGYFLLVDLAGQACPQFSLVAAVAAQAAVLLWFSRGPDRPWGPASLALFLILVALGVMIRPDHAVLIALLAGPLLVWDLGAALCGDGSPLRTRLRAWRGRTGGPLLTAGVLLVLLQGHHHWFYATSPGWEDFQAYNNLRGRCTDFRRDDEAPDVPTVLEKVGWTRNDLAMLKTFFFADREVYSAPRLRAYLEAAADQPLALPPLGSQLAGYWNYPVLRLLLAVALVPLLFQSRETWLRCIAVCAAVVLAWLLAAGILHHYCPWHLLQAMLSFAAAAGIALVGRPRIGAVRLTAGLAGVVLLTVAVVPGVRYLRERAAVVRAVAGQLRREVRALDPRPDQLFVVWGCSWPYEYLLPFGSLNDLRPFKIFALGCATHTPLTDHRLREFRIPDLVTGLYTREDVFLISYKSFLPLLKTFIAEHRGVAVEAQVVFDPPGSLFQVYRIRRATGAYATPEGKAPCP